MKWRVGFPKSPRAVLVEADTVKVMLNGALVFTKGDQVVAAWPAGNWSVVIEIEVADNAETLTQIADEVEAARLAVERHRNKRLNLGDGEL